MLFNVIMSILLSFLLLYIILGTFPWNSRITKVQCNSKLINSKISTTWLVMEKRLEMFYFCFDFVLLQESKHKLLPKKI